MDLQSNFKRDSLKRYPSCDLFLWKNVISDETAARSLAEEVQTLEFELTVNDLHNFRQTSELSSIPNLPHHVKKFVYLMDTQIREVVENLYNVKTKKKMTMTASAYNKGDYLLCHDDLCGDRQIAFVFYLTENWTESDGGALRFFNYGEEKNSPFPESYRHSFVPLFNSLVVFQVSTTSFHEVQEVFTDKSRLSINGWFHCDMSDQVEQEKCFQDLFFKSPLHQFSHYSNVSTGNPDPIMNRFYLHEQNISDLCKLFHRKTILLSHDFLEENFYNFCVKELEHNSLNWEVKGPPNYRKYEALEVHQQGNLVQLREKLPHINLLLSFLTSKNWLRYLNMVTQRELAVLSEEYVPPACMVEIQRWKEGCYSLLTDDDFLRKTSSLEVTIFFKVDSDRLDSHQKRAKTGTNVETSGKVVQIVKHIYPLRFLKALSQLKIHRMLLENNLRTRRGKHTLNMNARLIKIVEEKMEKIMNYRHSRASVHYKNNFVSPSNNAILMAINSETASKFTAYMKHHSAEGEDKVLYYSVSVIYLTVPDLPE